MVIGNTYHFIEVIERYLGWARLNEVRNIHKTYVLSDVGALNYEQPDSLYLRDAASSIRFFVLRFSLWGSNVP